VDPRSGEVLELIKMPSGTGVSGLESDGGDQFFCGGGNSGKVRVVRRPKGKNKDTARGRTGRRGLMRGAAIERRSLNLEFRISKLEASFRDLLDRLANGFISYCPGKRRIRNRNWVGWDSNPEPTP